eukprot:GAHX01000692.1.p1 GENE.GAHX01000692.1~~GAHX01000692.1.p1  ORF type:complete len:175 (-),score=41.04 GAHX01000692.1:71-595(-)
MGKNKYDERLLPEASLRPDLVNDNEQIGETCFGDVKAGNVVLSKDGFPSKVGTVKSAKTGKHGAAKFTLIMTGIFTGKSSTEQNNAGKQICIPETKKYDFEVYGYEDDELQMLDEESGEISIFKLDPETELGINIANKLNNEETVRVHVQEAQCMVLGKLNKVHYVSMAQAAKH